MNDWMIEINKGRKEGMNKMNGWMNETNKGMNDWNG